MLTAELLQACGEEILDPPQALLVGCPGEIDADTYCPDVVIQVASVTRALQEVAVGLLTDHLDRCVVNAARASEAGGQASLGEVASTIRQVIRL